MQQAAGFVSGREQGVDSAVTRACSPCLNRPMQLSRLADNTNVNVSEVTPVFRRAQRSMPAWLRAFLNDRLSVGATAVAQRRAPVVRQQWAIGATAVRH